jgi:hypothetical protein
MIITPHLILGAAIGAKIKHLGWIIILGIISHLILDRIPHWDYGSRAMRKFRQKKSYKALLVFFLKLIVDGLIGLTIVLLVVWQKNMMKLEYLLFIFIGIFFSLLPDLLLGVASLFFYNKKFAKIYIDFHHEILHNPNHIKKLTLLGLGAEILVSLIAILILLL